MNRRRRKRKRIKKEAPQVTKRRGQKAPRRRSSSGESSPKQKRLRQEKSTKRKRESETSSPVDGEGTIGKGITIQDGTFQRHRKKRVRTNQLREAIVRLRRLTEEEIRRAVAPADQTASRPGNQVCFLTFLSTLIIFNTYMFIVHRRYPLEICPILMNRFQRPSAIMRTSLRRTTPVSKLNVNRMNQNLSAK